MNFDDVGVLQLDAAERRLRQFGLIFPGRVGVDPLPRLRAERGFLRGVIEIHGGFPFPVIPGRA